MLNRLPINFNINTILWVFFSAYFIIGLSIFNDYGMSWDEPIERLTGLVNVKYISEKFSINKFICQENCDFENAPPLNEYKDRYYGSWFQIVARVGESILGMKTFYNFMRLRHLMVFILVFIGSFHLFKTIDYLFKDKRLALLCTALFITQPRFFAEQFYNTKDMVFLAITCIALYYVIKFLTEQTINSCIKAAIFSGLLIATRVTGIIILVEVLFILIFDLLLQKNIPVKTHLQNITLYCLISLGFTILFWPYLWSNPLHNFLEAFDVMKKFQWERTVLINGKNFNTQNLPWYYLPNWIIISTPILILFFIISAAILFIHQSIQNFKSNYYSITRIQLVSFGVLILPILAVVVMHAVVYDGWRHVYFTLVGGFIGIAWLFHQFSQSEKLSKYSNVLYSLALTQLIWNIYHNIQLHPYQNVYFNQFAYSDLKTNYELDYWGLSYKEGLAHILEIDNRKQINIHLIGSRDNLRYFEFPNDRIFNFVELKEADYFLTNYRWHPQDYPEYDEVYCINLGNTKIMSVYKLK